MATPDSRRMTLDCCRSITDIPERSWAALAGPDNPFLQYGFLKALEDSGCTTPATGWTPNHLVFHLDGELCGVAPAYLKAHSRGEYVFDWAWAEAYERYGLPYYPKLLLAIPFTPSQGPRLLLNETLRSHLAPDTLHHLLNEHTQACGAHSWHLLFPDATDQSLLSHRDELHRLGCQFHWQDHGYGDFDGFLASLTSRKRKSIRKERRLVSEQGIGFQWFHGTDITDHVLSAFYVFYQATYLKRGQRPYLNQRFFEQLRATLPEHLHLLMAVRDGEMIAGALFLSGGNTLYGRYWGCLDEYDHLHFETCYYQGIELALARGLTHFDAGAQGEHKLVRGFEPVITHSWHGIAHPAFRDAIARFTREEAEQVEAYYRESLSLLPFRNETGG